MGAPGGDFSFSTGMAPLPDVGTLEYNGATFSSLFYSRVGFVFLPDNAGRTCKAVEYTLTAAGMVTLQQAQKTIDPTMQSLRETLSAYGGTLTYSGKGLANPLVVNPAGGGGIRDVAWGPKPKVLSFQPLGASRSALVEWTVTFTITEFGFTNVLVAGGAGGSFPKPGTLLQFNEETTVTYDEDCYSSRSIKGTAEIPLTRTAQDDHTVSQTVDFYRKAFMTQVMNSIDLTRFRVTNRSFHVSRDKRTMEWELKADELPPMGLPPFCPSARGTYSVRPSRQSFALMPWMCSLKATYTVRKDQPRRTAWWAFASLLNWKMSFAQSEKGALPVNFQPVPGQPPKVPVAGQPQGVPVPRTVNDFAAQAFQRVLEAKSPKGGIAGAAGTAIRAMLLHFAFDEGLYLDSKTITFEASWWLVVTIDEILVASGFAQYDPGKVVGLPATTGALWAISVQDIMGWKGNLANVLDPKGDAIIDFGGV